jgi:DNA polymerase-3 subunit epsilon
MKYMVIDTEGSGLFDFKRPADAEGQPRLAEFAFALLDEDLFVTRETQMFVKPDGWEMTPESTEVNGLTTEFLETHGVPVHNVLDLYTKHVLEGYAIVAHNAQHDCKTMRAELRRVGMDDLFEQTPSVCTMRGAMPFKIKKLNGKGGFPGLKDVCAHFDVPQPKEHDALSDVQSTVRIFREMVLAGFKPEPAVHHSKNYEAIRSAT